MKTSPDIDQARWAKWVEVCHAIDPLAPTLKDFAHGLGERDAELVARERAYVAMTPAERTAFSVEMKLNDLLVDAALWVLGSYEVLRTMSQRIGSTANFVDATLGKRVKQVKIEFARVRMPIAKVEPPVVDWPSDSGVALPALHRKKGVAWKVANRVYVTRRDQRAVELHHPKF